MPIQTETPSVAEALRVLFADGRQHTTDEAIKHCYAYRQKSGNPSIIRTTLRKMVARGELIITQQNRASWSHRVYLTAEPGKTGVALPSLPNAVDVKAAILAAFPVGSTIYYWQIFDTLKQPGVGHGKIERAVVDLVADGWLYPYDDAFDSHDRYCVSGDGHDQFDVVDPKAVQSPPAAVDALPTPEAPAEPVAAAGGPQSPPQVPQIDAVAAMIQSLINEAVRRQRERAETAEARVAELETKLAKAREIAEALS